MDSRFIYDDPETEHYKARVFTSNTILLSAPAFEYATLNDRDEYASVDRHDNGPDDFFGPAKSFAHHQDRDSQEAGNTE